MDNIDGHGGMDQSRRGAIAGGTSHDRPAAEALIQRGDVVRTSRSMPTVRGARTAVGVAVVVAAAGFGVSAGATTVPEGGGDSTYMVEAREGPYTVGLANGFVGNSWRAQMVAELEYAVSQRDDIEDLLVTNADNDVSAAGRS